MPRTIYLSRLLGVFLLVLAVAELTQRSNLAATAMEFANSPALLLLSGMLTLVAGLAIVLAHNVWRGGAMQATLDGARPERKTEGRAERSARRAPMWRRRRVLSVGVMNRTH